MEMQVALLAIAAAASAYAIKLLAETAINVIAFHLNLKADKARLGK